MNNSTIEQCERTIRDVCAGRSCLDGCIERIRAAGRCRACRPPHPAARSRNAWKIVAALGVILALAALSLFADPVCTWDGTQYSCSGVGDRVIVLPGDGVVGPDAVTNYFGCCTNCTAIDPMSLSNLLVDIRLEAFDIVDFSNEVRYYIDNAYFLVEDSSREINGFRNSGFAQNGAATPVSAYASISNYLATSDNDQAKVVRSLANYPPSSPILMSRVLYANDAIYLYSNNYVKPKLQSELQWLDNAKGSLGVISSASSNIVRQVDDILPLLAKAPECGGGSSNSCSDVTGKWCTEEQGDAIIDLLKDQKSYLVSISNDCHAITGYLSGLYRTFMNLRGGIPAEDELDKSWQEIYLSDSTGSFAYGYTNVMERIELLLYGISGVGTNNTGFTSADNPFDEGDDTAQNEYDRTLKKFEDMDDPFEAADSQIQSLWDHLKSFFQAFQQLVGSTLEPETGLVGSFSFDFAQTHFDVPQVTTGSDVGLANQLQSICRVGMTALYWLVAGILGLKFHLWFLNKVLFFLKWAWELLNGLFS